jgi:anti-sigma factor RsiW
VSEEQAHALLDGELDHEQATVVREHLGRCRDCRAKVGRLSRFLAVLHRQRAGGTRAPASLRARIRALRPPAVAVVPADEPA